MKSRTDRKLHLCILHAYTLVYALFHFHLVYAASLQVPVWEGRTVIEAVANGGAAGLPFVVSTLIADSPQTTNSLSLSLSLRVCAAHNTHVGALRLSCLVTAVCQEMRSLSSAARAVHSYFDQTGTHFCLFLLLFLHPSPAALNMGQ